MMQAESRIFHSLRNISVGLMAQVLTMGSGFIARTIFVKFLAVEYLGVNSLFVNILSMLSLAELGIGVAFMYSLYKPMAHGEEHAVAAILGFYKKVYTTIGVIIFISGLLLIPFLDAIVEKKSTAITEDIRVIFLFFLANTSITYFFSYKLSILQAGQKMSVATINSTIFTLIQNVLQIVILALTANFLLYLAVQFFCNLGANLSLSRIVDKHYPFLKTHARSKIQPEVRRSIVANTKATFLTKIGGVLVNGTDNLTINYFVGLALLGKFSNYVLLISMVTNFLVIIFNNTNASIANVVAKESREKQLEVFKVINFANFWIYGMAAVFVIVLSNDFIELWIGRNFLLPMDVVIMLGINFFMLGMQNAIWAFKSAMGIFQQGKYLVLGTAAINLALSVLLGSYFGIFGVLLATALARLVTNFWYDPYLVCTLGLKINPRVIYGNLALYFVLLTVSIILITLCIDWIKLPFWVELFSKVLLCMVIPNALIFLTYRQKPEMALVRTYITNALKLRNR